MQEKYTERLVISQLVHVEAWLGKGPKLFNSNFSKKLTCFRMKFGLLLAQLGHAQFGGFMFRPTGPPLAPEHPDSVRDDTYARNFRFEDVFQGRIRAHHNIRKWKYPTKKLPKAGWAEPQNNWHTFSVGEISSLLPKLGRSETFFDHRIFVDSVGDQLLSAYTPLAKRWYHHKINRVAIALNFGPI